MEALIIIIGGIALVGIAFVVAYNIYEKEFWDRQDFMETYDIDEMLWPYWAQILYNYDLEGPLWVTYGDGKIRNKMLDAGYLDWDSVWDDFEIRY